MAPLRSQDANLQGIPLPGPDPSPYAMGIDADGYIWYDSHYMDRSIASIREREK